MCLGGCRGGCFFLFCFWLGKMSVDAASLRTVVVQLRSLAADKDNQPIIARDEG